MMVGKRAQKGLENGSPHKQTSISLFISIISKDIHKGVQITLQPERSTRLNIPAWLQRIEQGSRLAGIDDYVERIDIGRSIGSKGSHSRFEFSQKPFVPIGKSIVRLTRITLKLSVIDFLLSFRGEPTPSSVVHVS